MSKHTKFSLEQEETVINFVRSHEILYNVWHKSFRRTEKKNKLWLQLANQLDIDADTVKKKWGTMRDYYIRKKKAGSACTSLTVKRDEALSFLLDTYTLKRTNQSSLKDPLRPSINDHHPYNVKEEAMSVSSGTADIGDVDDFENILSPVDFLVPKPQEPKDSLAYFFESIASTMRTFDPITIARLKLKISRMVGEEEIAAAEKAEAGNSSRPSQQ